MWIAKNVHENKTELRVFQQGGGPGVINIMYLKTKISKYQTSFLLMVGQKKCRKSNSSRRVKYRY